MDRSPIEISIVVPVYNSAQIISELSVRIQQAMESMNLNYELILVDDHSPDESWRVISEICSSNERVIGLQLAKNYGQWCSSLAGISRAKGQYIVTIDDDLEYDPKDILKLYSTITNSSYRVVFGIAPEKYLLQGKNEKASRLRNVLLNAFWNKGATDSFKIFERALLFEGYKFHFDIHFEAFITKHLDKIFWGYCPVSFNKRVIGSSNHSFQKKAKLFCLFSLHYIWGGRGIPCFLIDKETNKTLGETNEEY